MADERTVLHVGPVNTRGGMATVIRILSENPPDGWHAETLATHTEGSALSKFLCWRRARRQLIARIKQNPPDVVHIHTASDYSWWRKRRVALLCNKSGIPVIIHIHSGKFDSFCRSKFGEDIRKICAMKGIHSVVLSKIWKERLEEWIPNSTVIHNPVDPEIVMQGIERKPKQILFMGRDDPVKRAEIAIDAVRVAREKDSELQLIVTGIDAEHRLAKPLARMEWFHPLGWVSEEKKRLLLNESAMMLVPSEYECQPMVVLEAQTCGLAVVGSPAVSEVCDDIYVVSSWEVNDWANIILNNSHNFETVPQGKNDDEIKSIWGILYHNVLAPVKNE